MARSQRTSNPVTLFPFLAVLLCTIGALVLMLVVVSAGIRKDAVAKSRTISEPVISDPVATTLKLEEPIVDVRERTFAQKPIEPLLARDTLPSPIKEAPPRTLAEIADLEKVTRKLEAEVANRVKRLSSVSVKTHALRKQLRTVKAQQNDLQLQIIRTANQRAKLEESTGELRVENQQIIEWLDESQKLIDEHKHQLVSPVHSIVPYDGQTGTVRRPIIIECVGDVVRFEAEQVEIPVAILQKFSPEQNPLASAVQALFRYWMAKEQISDPGRQSRTPYALILVRPSGAEAFSSAVFALDEMVGDFGYELVETEFLYEVPETTADAVRECRAAVEAEIRRGPVRSRRTLNPQGPIDIARVARGPAASRGFFRSADFKNRRAVGTGGDGTGNGTSDLAGDGSSGFGDEEDVGAAVASAAARRREAELKAATDRARNLLQGRGAEAASLLEKGLPPSFDQARAAAMAEAVRTDGAGMSEPNAASSAFAQGSEFPFGGGESASRPVLQPGDVDAGATIGNRSGDHSETDALTGADTGDQKSRNANGQPRWLANTDGRPAVGTGDSNPDSGDGSSGGERGSLNRNTPDSGGGGGNGRGAARGRFGENRQGVTSGEGATSSFLSDLLERRAATSGSTAADRPFGQRSQLPGEPSGTSSSSLASGATSGQQSSTGASTGGNSPASSGGPSIAARPQPNPVRSMKVQRRWGRSDPNASLGLEKVVEIRIETSRIVVGNQFQVTRTPERSEADIVKLTIQTIEHLAHQWGLPPPRFYWVPSVHLVVEPAEQRLEVLLEAAIEDAGAALE